MLPRSCLFVSILLCLTACQHVAVKPSSRPVVMRPIQQYPQVSEFTRVSVAGRMNVNLHTGYSHPQVILHGDPRDLAYVQTKVSNGGLYVILGSGYPQHGNVSVDIKGHYLNAFSYHGAGIVKGMSLTTGLMDVDIENQGNTTLQGQVGLHKLTVKGSGSTEIIGLHSSYLQLNLAGKPTVRLSGLANIADLKMADSAKLSLYWVKSTNLMIRATDRADIQLAGKVGRLQVELWGQSHFNGRYLRAEEAFIKTHGLSIAEIASVDHQHTLASDRSDIRFYNLPTTETDFMIKQGAVLDMREGDTEDRAQNNFLFLHQI
jgi:hypothetical protein